MYRTWDVFMCRHADAETPWKTRCRTICRIWCVWIRRRADIAYRECGLCQNAYGHMEGGGGLFAGIEYGSLLLEISLFL